MLRSNFEVNITTFDGLEDVLCDEVREIIGGNVQRKKRLVKANTDLEGLYRLNYQLRTGLRVLVPIFTATVTSDEELYEAVKSFAWENIFDVKQTFYLAQVIHSSIFTHSMYAVHKVKDGIVDRFSEKENRRPNVDTKYPEVLFNVHIYEDKLTISLDASGEPLFKRGYRVDTNEAPLNEVLAAGLVLNSQWDKRTPFYDAMCGSGTVLIEAAMIAGNIPPRRGRKHYAFMAWKNYDHTLFNKVKDDCLSEINKDMPAIHGSDLSRAVIRVAKQNADNAGVLDYIKFIPKDIRKPLVKHECGFMIINPPYDERLEIENINEFYQEIGLSLETNFKGFITWIFTSSLEALDSIPLPVSKKKALRNGSLDCRFYQYNLTEDEI